MDAAYRNPTRRFPGHTDAELESSLIRQTDPERREMIATELANRKAGISKHFATPQVAGGRPVIGNFKSQGQNFFLCEHIAEKQNRAA